MWHKKNVKSTIGLYSRRLVFYTAGVLVLLLVSMDIGMFITARQSDRNLQLEKTRSALDHKSEVIGTAIHNATSDLLFLAEEISRSGILENRFSETREHLGETFRSISRYNDEYDQVRYLDQNGMEVVRVNQVNGQPYIVRVDNLQNKGSRYYFKDSVVLGKGQVFVSHLDLNVEQGLVEMPYKPMIRFATPVFDRAKHKQGVVIINVKAQPALERLRKTVNPEIGRFILLNEEGYYLIAPDPAIEWGFMFENKKDKKLGNFDPDAWAAINGAESGRVETKEGMYTFLTMDPFAPILEMGAKTSGRKGNEDHWKLVYFVDTPSYSAGMEKLILQMIGMNVLTLCLLAVAAFIYIRLGDSRRNALEEHHKLYQAVEQSPVTVVITDMNGAISYVNPKFCETTGYTLEEAIGQNPNILKSGKQPVEVYRQLWKTISSGNVWRGELQNKRKNGELYWEFVSISPFKNEKGQTTHFLAVKEDITERKRAEVELRRAIEAAETANRAKSDFLATMSHEIRTPMNGILGMTDLALQTELNHQQKEYLTIVQRSARSLLNLLNDILDLSKIESGRFDLRLSAFSLREVVGQAVKTIAPTAHEKELELTCRIDPKVPDGLKGDPGRLAQVLLNLLGNAVKFTPKGEVALEVLPHQSGEEKDEVHFLVRDTGIGIRLDKQRDIFSPFTQVDGSSTREYGGTGLGLSISSQLVDLMGGRIWVESREGIGSTFHFTAGFEPDETSQIWNFGENRLSGNKVLVMDDHSTTRNVLVDMLSYWGAETEEASNSSQALEALVKAAQNENGFDLAIMDLGKGDQDVLQMASEMLKTESLKDVKTVFLTCPDSLETKCQPNIENKNIRPDSILVPKPVVGKELFRAVDAVLNGTPLEAEDDDTDDTDVGFLRHGGLHVLVAEDNAINQKVAKRLLEKRGHTVQIVDSGQQVLEILEKEEFDLILMDIKMPGLNGMETTHIIRSNEAQRNLPRIPILALTAQAMKGDREQCLEAGMDGYIAKPIEADLFDLAILTAITSGQASCSLEPANELPVIDEQELRNRMDGDDDLMKELILLFLSELPAKMNEIKKAIEDGNGREMELASKSLAASAGHFSAKAAIQSLRNLEKIGTAFDRARAEPAYSEVVREIDRLEREFKRFL